MWSCRFASVSLFNLKRRWTILIGSRYWDWTLYLGTPYNLTSSPMFDGTATSLSNNGAWDPDLAPIVVGGGAILPRGTGGGCVTEGPFVNHTVSLGPFDFSLVFTGVPDNWTVANPRCSMYLCFPHSVKLPKSSILIGRT